MIKLEEFTILERDELKSYLAINNIDLSSPEDPKF